MSRRDDCFFIYPKTKNGKRTGHCIAVVLRNGLMFEGTSLCSEEDQFSKKEGRKLSLERAEAAYQRYIIRQEQLK